MIKLNDLKYYIKEFPSAEGILSHVTDLSIFKYYYPTLEVNALIHSPFRNDKNPSFGVFWSTRYNKLLFKDFGTNLRGDVFVFLTHLWKVSYIQVLNQIVVDFNLTDYFVTNCDKRYNKDTPVIYPEDYCNNLIKNNSVIQITVRRWNKEDVKFWSSYGIKKSTLEKYRVYPISYIFLNENIIKADKLAYAFREDKDNITRYKIYQPYSENLKWINNMVEGTLSGFSQLSQWGATLFITSSLKDAMCLHDIGYTNVVAPQSEGYIFKPHIIKDFKDRFDKIYVFYDNDDAGKKASRKLCLTYNLFPIFTDIFSYKDPTDYYKKLGKDKLLSCIKSQL